MATEVQQISNFEEAALPFCDYPLWLRVELITEQETAKRLYARESTT